MAEAEAMIEPFESGQVRESENGRIISYGTSSYGYDVRCADEFKIFNSENVSELDPKKDNYVYFTDIKADSFLIPPNSFILANSTFSTSPTSPRFS